MVEPDSGWRGLLRDSLDRILTTARSELTVFETADFSTAIKQIGRLESVLLVTDYGTERNNRPSLPLMDLALERSIPTIIVTAHSFAADEVDRLVNQREVHSFFGKGGFDVRAFEARVLQLLESDLTGGDTLPALPRCFVCYSREDLRWLDQLDWVFDGLDLELWSDEDVMSGERWREAIDRSIESSRAALLLVSKAFFDSAYIRENELPALYSAARDHKMPLLWVAVGESQVNYSELADYKALHDPERPLGTLTEDELSKALRAIRVEVRRALGMPVG